MSFTKVATTDQLWHGEMLRIEHEGIDLLLVNYQDQFFAYRDRCPHQGASLSEGKLTDRTLQCCAHHWEFAIDTGEGLNPKGVALKKFEVKVVGNDIFLDLTDKG